MDKQWENYSASRDSAVACMHGPFEWACLQEGDCETDARIMVCARNWESSRRGLQELPGMSTAQSTDDR